MKSRVELPFYVSVGVGMALATSSFTMVSGLLETVSGFWVPLAVVLAGLVCIVLSLSIAELASMFPSAPGIRTYFKTAFGDRMSLFLVYLYLIFVVLIAGVESSVFGQVARAIFPQLSPLSVVLTLLGVVIVTNLLGLDLPRGMQMLTSFAAVAIILGVGVLGWAGAPLKSAPFEVGDAGAALLVLPAAVGLAIFLFMGFEWVTPLGLSPQAYERKVPLSMPIAIAVLMVTYTVFVIGLLGYMPRQAIIASQVPHVPYLQAVLGTKGVYLAGILSLSAIFSTFNAGIMGGSQILYTLSREGCLPRWCSTMAVSTGAPIGATLLLGSLTILSSLAVVTLRLELLFAVIGAAIICWTYGGFMLATLRLRKLAPEKKRTYKTPIYAWLQWAILLLLVLIGTQSLFVQTERRYLPSLGAVLGIVAAFLLCQWSARRAAALRPQRPARRPPAPSLDGGSATP